MAITFFGVATVPADDAAQAGPGPLTITPPSSMTEGDLVIVHVTHRRAWDGGSFFSTGIAQMHDSSNVPTATGGQEWHSTMNHRGAPAGSTDIQGRIWWCRFNGTWTADPAFRIYSGTNALGAQMLVFRPSSTSKVWTQRTAARATYAAGSSPFTRTITGITTTTQHSSDSHLLLGVWCTLDKADTFGSLSGTNWTQGSLASEYANTTGTGTSTAYAYQIQTSSAASNNVSLNQSAGNVGCTFLAYWTEHDPAAEDGTAASASGGPVQYATKIHDDVGGSLSTLTASFASAVTSGNTVLVYLHYEDSTAANHVLKVEDDKGNEYFLARLQTDQAYEQGAAIYYRSNVTNAPTDITVTIKETNSFAFGVYIAEFPGAWVLDATSARRHNTQDSGNPEVVTADPSRTPSADGALAFFGAHSTGSAFAGDAWTEISPWTKIVERRDTTNFNPCAIFWEYQSTAASLSCTATSAAMGSARLIIGAYFVPVAGASGSPWHYRAQEAAAA